MLLPVRSSVKSQTRILVIEDNPISRQLMQDYLEYQGYSILSLPTGGVFESAMVHFRPHLVLLDLKLPDVDGFMLLERIQQHPEWSKIPVVVISAFAFQADRQRALSLGASQYLVKPVNLTQLTQTIDELLNFQLVS